MLFRSDSPAFRDMSNVQELLAEAYNAAVNDDVTTAQEQTFVAFLRAYKIPITTPAESQYNENYNIAIEGFHAMRRFYNSLKIEIEKNNDQALEVL